MGTMLGVTDDDDDDDDVTLNVKKVIKAMIIL